MGELNRFFIEQKYLPPSRNYYGTNSPPKLLSGAFLFLLVVLMDVVDAQRTLNKLHDKLEKHQNLNRAFMNSQQMIAIDEVMASIHMRMKNIQSNFNQEYPFQ